MARNGLWQARARALAAEVPTRRELARPGPAVAAKASTSARRRPASARTASVTGRSLVMWLREASSGTTPP